MSENESLPHSPDYQLRIFAALLREPRLYYKKRILWKPHHFQDPKVCGIARVYFEYLSNSKARLTPDLETLLNLVIVAHDNSPHEFKAELKGTLELLYLIAEEDKLPVPAEVIKYLIKKTTEDMTLDLASRIDSPTLNQHLKEMLKIRQANAEFETFRQIYEAQYSKRPWIVKWIVRKGNKVMFVAPSKAKKTWASLALALCAKTGLPWLGQEIIKCEGRVLYVGFELEKDELQERLIELAELYAKRLGTTSKDYLDEIDTLFLEDDNFSVEELVERIIDRAADGAYDLIIFDPIYMVYGDKDENSASDMAAIFKEVKRMGTETGAAVFIVHHFAKGGFAAKEAADRFSGSGVFRRAFGIMIVMSPLEKFAAEEEADYDPDAYDPEPSYQVEVISGRSKAIPPFAVTWHFPEFVRDELKDGHKLKGAAGRPKKYDMSVFVNLFPHDAPLKPADAKRMAKDILGMAATTFDIYFADAKNRNLLVNEPGNGWRRTNGN